MQKYIAQGTLKVEYRELAEETYHAKIDEMGHWTKLHSELMLAAHVIDPEFHEQRPWEDDAAMGALNAVVTRLLYPLVGEAHATALRAVP